MPDEPPPYAGRGPSPTGASLAGLRPDELLGEVQDRLTEIVKTRDRLQGLLDAVLAVVELVDARYGALGVGLMVAGVSRPGSSTMW